MVHTVWTDAGRRGSKFACDTPRCDGTGAVPYNTVPLYRSLLGGHHPLC